MSRLFFFTVILFFNFLFSQEEIIVDVNPGIEYQTILGWGAPAGLIHQPDNIIDIIIDESVNSLGLTRLRFEIPRREWEDYFNDDGDPYHINWASFKTNKTDKIVKKVILPFKNRVENNKEPFSLYISPSFFNGGSSGSVPPYLLYSPAEYTEWAIAMLIYLRDKYDIIPEYYCICNEAGNNNPFNPKILAEIGKVLGEKLKEMGFKTKIQFPECVDVNSSWNYIKAVENDYEFWKYVGLVSYHLYGRNEERTNIRDFSWKRGLPTGQTEFMGLNVNHLYEDLTNGGVSYWEFYALLDYIKFNNSKTWFSFTPNFWEIRQIIHYVRPGAKRIESISNNSNLRTLAFLKDGKITLIILNKGQISFPVKINGLPDGTYGLSWTEKGVYQEGGLINVKNSQPLSLNIHPDTILTIYPHQKNIPPVIIEWGADPSFLKLPENKINLYVKAIDPEGEKLEYEWKILEKPEDVSLILTSPHSPKTFVSGLTKKGDYVFSVSINDGKNEIFKKVVVSVYDKNQPPQIFDLHNRIPVNVTLPESKTVLRAGVFDIENDPLSYHWSIVSQPPGANPVLENPDKLSCNVSNLKIPGDYIFRFKVSDTFNVVWEDLKVTVYQENSPPVIEEVKIEPSELKLPLSKIILKAKVRDPEGDITTSYWSIKKCPLSAKIYFEKPGLPTTQVSGYFVSGEYIFTITAIDRTKFTSRDVKVSIE